MYQEVPSEFGDIARLMRPEGTEEPPRRRPLEVSYPVSRQGLGEVCDQRSPQSTSTTKVWSLFVWFRPRATHPVALPAALS